MKRLPRLLILFTLTGLFGAMLWACESKEAEEKAAEPKVEGEPAGEVDLAKVDLAAQAQVLAKTFLHAASTRERALVDVLEVIWGFERDKTQTDHMQISALCKERAGERCAEAADELHYYIVYDLALKTLEGASSEASPALELARQNLGDVPELPPMEWLQAAEPLSFLWSDLVLYLSFDTADISLGGGRLYGIPYIDEAGEPSQALEATLLKIRTGDSFGVVAKEAPVDEGKPENPGDGVLRVGLHPELDGATLKAFLKRANKAGFQNIELVVRSQDYPYLGVMKLNLVPSGVKGGKHALVVDEEQVIWHDYEQDETLAVSYGDLARLGDIVGRPSGQLLLYVGVDDELKAAKLVQALSAARSRCDEQELCPRMQMALALK